MTTVTVAVSVGELIDKITILEIKTERINAPSKLANVRTELDELRQARDTYVASSPGLDALNAELKAVNETLWEIENGVREHERNKFFNARFIELVRAVYLNNDQRSAIKRRINELTGSHIVDEKVYSEY